MASSYLINVPKLKGRDNYSEWCFAAENFLILEGMKHCIKPESGKEIASADDEKTKAKLIMTIDPSLYVHVKNVKSSKELWNKLQQLFDDSGFSRRISLLRNLISIRRENCSSMTSYVTQIIDTAQKLSGTGFEINDQWTGSLLLAGLPDRFAPMIMAIEHSGISITADNIKTKLLDMESVDYNESEMNVAFVSNSNHAKQNKNNLSMAKKSYNDANTSTTVTLKPNTKAVKCYRCKQVGHYKNQCMNNEHNLANNKNKERMQSNAFGAVFLSANFNKNDWYIDSGASVHLTANESWVMNARYKQNKEIVVANNKKMTVLCSGDVKITTSTDDCEYDIVIEDVCCIPTLTTNLLSVSQLIKKGNSVSFTDKGCCVYNKKQQLVATAVLVNGVYKVNLVSQEYLAASAVSGGVTWHRRLGHVNKDLYSLVHTDICVAKQKRKKWDKKSMKCILTGYPDNIKGYSSECMIQVQDQNVASVGDKIQPEQKSQKVTSFESTSSLDDNLNSENYSTCDEDNDKTYVPTDCKDSDNQCDKEYFMDRPRRTRKPPERYGMSNLCTSTTYDDGAILTPHDALNGPEKKQRRCQLMYSRRL